MSRFLFILREEITSTLPFSHELLSSLLSDLTSSLGLLTVSIAISLGVTASVLVAAYRHSLPMRILAELLAVIMAASPILLPFKAARFFLGLYLFASFMTVNASVCLTRSNPKPLETVNTNTNTGVEESRKHAEAEIIKTPANATNASNAANAANAINASMLQEIKATFNANLPSRLSTTAGRPPSLPRLLYTVVELLLVDAVIFLMREAVPLAVRPSNRALAVALLGGVWVLLSMDLFYCNLATVLQIIGHPIPLTMRHRHPLLSTSLAEFWGVRWNPIICKLLQDSFYKPLRSIGAPRVVCVIGCFIGSGLLHAWPQFASTHSIYDATSMFLFFLSQGVLVILEQSLLGITADTHKSVGAPYQWLLEILVVAAMLSSAYVIAEGLPYSAAIVAGIALVVLAAVLLFQRSSSLKSPSPRVVMRPLLGWLWTLSCVILTLPLFSAPCNRAVETLYDRSYIVGPIVRSISRAQKEQLATAHSCAASFNVSAYSN